MNRARANWILIAVWTGAALVFAIALWRTRTTAPPPIKSLASFQDADAPLLMPADGKPDFRVHRLGTWQSVGLPTAVRFDEPLGSEAGAFAYNAQPFWDLNEPRGGHHTGDDLNGIGGMNTDLGDPVFAPADGTVIFAGEPSPGWGKIVILAHRLADGRQLHSMHAHLDRVDVALGALVARGSRLGTVGTANGNYPAHLHFELRESDGADIGGGYGAQPLNRLDPAEAIATLRGTAADDLSPAPLAVALTKAGEDAWSGIQIEGAERLSEILGKEK